MPSKNMNPDTLAHNIPSGLEETDKIAGRAFQDWLWIIAPPALIMIFTYFTVKPEGLTAVALITTTIAFILGIIHLHPNHLSVKEWLGDIRHFKRRQKTVSSESNAPPVSDTEPAASSRMWEHDDRTQENTHVHAFHPDLDVVERLDGTFVGGVEVTGVNMALSSSDEWARQKQNYKQFFNRSCDFPLQVYSTTERFPIDDHIGTFEERQTDEDMRANPIKAQLLESYMQKTLADTVSKNLSQRKVYMFVSATDRDILSNGVSNVTLIEGLSTVPVLGDIVTAYFGNRDMSDEEKREEKAEIVHERLQKVHSQAINPLHGCASSTLQTEELAVLLREHWTNREAQFDPASETLLRSSPIVTGN